MAKALYEKIQMNAEDIGKKKMEQFNIRTVEQVRAIYKENDRLFNQLVGVLTK